MRKFFVTTALLLGFVWSSSAQYVSHDRGAEWRDHEIGLAHGMVTQQLLINSFVKIFSLGFADIDTMLYGATSGEYLYYVNKHIGLGGTLGYEFGREGQNADYKARFHYLTVMPTAKFYWFNRPYVGMYTRMSLGATFGLGSVDQQQSMRVLPAFHLGAVAVEVGGKFRFFTELGFGSLGLIQAGFRFKF